VQPGMGTRLPSLLRAVGLQPQPPYELTGAMYSGTDVLTHVTTVMGGISPLLAAYGIATEEEIESTRSPNASVPNAVSTQC
jgi:hypothetical protein